MYVCLVLYVCVCILRAVNLSVCKEFAVNIFIKDKLTLKYLTSIVAPFVSDFIYFVKRSLKGNYVL